MKKIKLTEEQRKLKQKDLRLRKTYGITLEDWQKLSKNGCWICGKTNGRLNVDHRHVPKYKTLDPQDKAKEVRGCLCFMCNTMLHGVEKRKRARFFLERMNEYFSVFKMVGDK